MPKLTKISINFDLNIKKLKEYYNKKSYTTAYLDIRKFMENHDFEHIQGSGYVSKNTMSKSKMAAIIYEMSKRYPWLYKSTKISKATHVSEDSYSLEEILQSPYKINRRNEQ